MWGNGFVSDVLKVNKNSRQTVGQTASKDKNAGVTANANANAAVATRPAARGG